ncbi:unnamed protein product [Leptosia nina]|uniref:Uncharacterized protein n=1 Tax=Leptosia nina TaxID=320188 RepID=A0AAV1JNS7_9NEOP
MSSESGQKRRRGHTIKGRTARHPIRRNASPSVLVQEAASNSVINGQKWQQLEYIEGFLKLLLCALRA